MLLVNNVSLDSSVIITTRLRAGRSGVRILARAKDLFLLLTCLYPLWGPPSLQLSGSRGSLAGIKRPGFEIYHAFPSGAEIKNEWSCTFVSPIRLHVLYMDSFTL